MLVDEISRMAINVIATLVLSFVIAVILNQKFKGRVLILEIKYTNGSLYSVSGSLKPLTNTQSARYRSLGILAEY